MKLSGMYETVAIVVLIGLISFMPRLLSFIVETGVGRAIAFGAVTLVWKQHNELLAILLAVAFLRAIPAYEHADDASMKKKDSESKKTSNGLPGMSNGLSNGAPSSVPPMTTPSP
jgi:predicted outer membrane lipoprotein